MRLSDLLRTTSFRLALTFLVLFSVAATALFSYMAWETTNFLSERVDEWLFREAKGLSTIPADDVATRLTARQRLGEKMERPLERPFTLFDADGMRLAGADIEMPPNAPGSGIPFNFLLSKAGHRYHFRGIVYQLSSGERVLVAQDIEEQLEFDELLTRTILFASLVIAVLGLIGAGFVGVGSVRRIDGISSATRRIIRGDFTQRLPTIGNQGDINRLASVVNDMLDEIERLMTEVKGVCDNIAHDMRTPLTRVLAGLERARRRSTTVKDYQAHADEAIAELHGILRTFSAMLRISEIEDGARRSGFTNVDLDEVVTDAVEYYEPLAEERGVSLRYAKITQAPLAVSGDPSLLFEAIGNLIDNAIKFTPAGGEATVRLEMSEGKPRIVVEDTGCGISPEDADAVFRRFHRSERSRHTPGNGLGLSLVAAISRLHNVDVSIEQRPVGSRFILQFARLG
ncbi:MAG: two-component sensor histidine kinase protein [Rhizobium sp.]|nr:two-component sensor histidine kinase protein [Rhizobium sp.]